MLKTTTTKRRPTSRVVLGRSFEKALLICSHGAVDRVAAPRQRRGYGNSPLAETSLFPHSANILEPRLFFPVGISEPIYLIHLCLLNHCRSG